MTAAGGRGAQGVTEPGAVRAPWLTPCYVPNEVLGTSAEMPAMPLKKR